MKTEMTAPGPGIAATLNLLIPGLGYVYIGRRVKLGYALIALNVLVLLYLLSDPFAFVGVFALIIKTRLIIPAAALVVGVSVAVDAYRLVLRGVRFA